MLLSRQLKKRKVATKSVTLKPLVCVRTRARVCVCEGDGELTGCQRQSCDPVVTGWVRSCVQADKNDSNTIKEN